MVSPTFSHLSALETQHQGDNIAADHWRRKEISLLDIATALSIAVTIVALAPCCCSKCSRSACPARRDCGPCCANRFVLITSLSVVAATLFGQQLDNINGPEEIGGFLLFMFLFTIGLPADLLAVILNVPDDVRALLDHGGGEHCRCASRWASCCVCRWKIWCWR